MRLSSFSTRVSVYPAGAKVREWTLLADGSDAPGKKERDELVHSQAEAYVEQFKLLWKTLCKGDAAALDECLLTFDDVANIFPSFRILTPLTSDETWSEHVLYTCSCKQGQDKGVCKHVLHEGVRSKRVEIPEDMLLGMIGRKPKVGAPRKTKKPREHQPGEKSTFFGHV